jgi:bacterioferritin-associated ferredoxin
MYVCLCQGITDKQIRAAVASGATSLEAVRHSLGVASQCGQCGDLAGEIVSESLESCNQNPIELFYAIA